MTQYVCKILICSSKRLLRKLQKKSMVCFLGAPCIHYRVAQKVSQWD